jgi:hypothetical protein
VKHFAGFIAATIAVVCVGAWIIARAMPGQDVARSVWASAIVVMIVQAAAFSIAWMMRPVNVIAGWGMGMLLRLFALVLFGMFGVKALGLSLQPALLSMAGFFFISTLIEPVFLKP